MPSGDTPFYCILIRYGLFQRKEFSNDYEPPHSISGVSYLPNFHTRIIEKP